MAPVGIEFALFCALGKQIVHEMVVIDISALNLMPDKLPAKKYEKGQLLH